MAEPIISERGLLAGIGPQVLNVTLTLANTEYPLTIPSGTRKFSLKTRDANHVVKFSFEAGTSGTTYVTLDGITYNEDMVLVREVTLYCQSATAGVVLECIIWS